MSIFINNNNSTIVEEVVSSTMYQSTKYNSSSSTIITFDVVGEPDFFVVVCTERSSDNTEGAIVSAIYDDTDSTIRTVYVLMSNLVTVSKSSTATSTYSSSDNTFQIKSNNTSAKFYRRYKLFYTLK